MGRPVPGKGNWIENTFQWIGGLQQVTDIFGQFSYLLMANADAAHGSFISFIGLIEVIILLSKFICQGMSHLGYIFSGFTIFSMLRRLFNWLLGRPNVEQKKSSLANEFRPKKTLSWSTVLAILGMGALTAPILFIFLNKLKQSFAEDDDEEEEHG